MSPTLLPPDRQATYRPVWFCKSSWFPRVYATRDIDIPSITPGVGFNVGDSVIGGDDLVGGGAGPLWRQAYRGILNTPVVTRKIGEPQWPMVDVQDVTVEIAHDGELLGDWRGAPFTLSAYDAESGFLLLAGAFVIFRAVHNRGVITITGKNVDQGILATEIPKGKITRAEFPLAAPDAIGQTPTWLLGNVTNLPLPCVRDDQVKSQFDYLLCRDTAAALTRMRRVTPGGLNPFVDFGDPPDYTNGFDELEPYPGMDAFPNLGFEDWDAGVAVAPDGWVLAGAGGSVAKNITAGQFEEGSASASLTRAGANTSLTKDLMADAPFLPASWWQGREITVTARVRATAAVQARLSIIDSAGAHNMPTYHTGSGLFETLSWTSTLDAATTVASIQVRVEVNGTAQFDKVQVYLHAKNFNECLRPDLYPGYTAIRCFLRQEDSSGALFQLVADVHGLQPERNPVRAIRTLLSDPTHGLGKTVDPVTFDDTETALCFTYDDAVRLDGPQWYINFRDPMLDSFGIFLRDDQARDRSGYERHAAMSSPTAAFPIQTPGPSGDANDPYFVMNSMYLTIPYDVRAGFDSPDTHVFEVWYYIDAAVVTGTDLPILEKRIGLAAKSGRYLSQTASTLVYGVRSNGGTLATCAVALAAGTDTQKWLHLVGIATGGALSLYKGTIGVPPVLVASGTYAGSLDTGDGVTALGQWGTGIATLSPSYRIARPAMYSADLSAARILAHFNAMPLDVEGVDLYDALITAKSPTFSSRMDEPAGSTALVDITGAHNGTWVGGVLMGAGVPGPLALERGIGNTYAMARFQNDVSKYGIETGMTLADPAWTYTGWYRPAALVAKSGLIEKWIGSPGVAATQGGFCQRSSVVRWTMVHAGGTLTLDAPLLAEDVGRETRFTATGEAGAVQVYKNGVLAAEGTYTAPVASGVGDFYVGVQATAAAGRTRPCQGDLGRWSYHPVHFTQADETALQLAATWYNGGLVVDAALREPRAARAWLEQFCLLRGIRLGMTPDGPITVTCDAAPATTIRLHARDGAGDGERTIKSIGDSQYPPLDETVADVVVRGRRDLLSNAWLVERRRTVHSNMGTDKPVELDCVREYPALDRVAAYLAGRILAGEKTVEVTMGQEARSLMEGELVEVTDSYMGLDGEIMEARSVGKSLPSHAATLQGWSEDAYLFEPTSYPTGSGSG